VKSRGRSRFDRNPSTQSQAQKAPETLTKRQRQNASRRDAQKTHKADAEAERLATLAKHQRELEKSRMEEYLSTTGKKVSGGMKAAVDSSGKLVWE